MVAKWFNKGEADELEATSLRRAWVNGNVRLYSPSLMLFEVANSIWKNPKVTTATARSLVKVAVRVSPALINLEEGVAALAMRIAKRTKSTFYDAVYVALAKSFSLQLITADQKQFSVSSGYAKVMYLSSFRGSNTQPTN